MNERIRDLQIQAFSECKTFEGSKVVTDDVFEKFAQLIVRECIREIGYKRVELLDIDFYPHYQERLRKHFGVEE